MPCSAACYGRHDTVEAGSPFVEHKHSMLAFGAMSNLLTAWHASRAWPGWRAAFFTTALDTMQGALHLQTVHQCVPADPCICQPADSPQFPCVQISGGLPPGQQRVCHDCGSSPHQRVLHAAAGGGGGACASSGLQGGGCHPRQGHAEIPRGRRTSNELGQPEWPACAVPSCYQPAGCVSSETLAGKVLRLFHPCLPCDRQSTLCLPRAPPQHMQHSALLRRSRQPMRLQHHTNHHSTHAPGLPGHQLSGGQWRQHGRHNCPERGGEHGQCSHPRRCPQQHQVLHSQAGLGAQQQAPFGHLHPRAQR